MLSAAPEEILDFPITHSHPVSEEKAFVPAIESLSVRKRKKLKERIKELKEAKLEKEHTSSKKRLVPSIMPPIDEKVFQEGMDWLDTLAGPPLPKGKCEMEFDESVWKSSVRRMEKY